MDSTTIAEIIRSELKPAIGCTEPAAVAFAATVARGLVPGEVEAIDVAVDANVFKNGAGVYVPGSGGLTGLAIAAALGALAGRADLGLEVLRDVDAESAAAAAELAGSGRVSVSIAGDEPGLRIAATVRAGGHSAEVIITGDHTHISSLAVDGAAVDQPQTSRSSAGTSVAQPSGRALKDLGLMSLVETILASDDREWAFLVPLAETNLQVATDGISRPQGLGIGAHMKHLAASGLVANDLLTECITCTAAAADARMHGARLPVISTNGSGNQGLAISIPIAVAAHRLPGGERRMAKALAVGQVSAIYLKQYIGKLSALCACAVASAIGSAIGITYLLGGGPAEMEAAGNLVAANLTGMICDGAKVGCALKLASSSAAAVLAALLAADSVTISADNGVVGSSLEETIRNIGRVSNPGMVETDSVILSIVEEKVCHCQKPQV